MDRSDGTVAEWLPTGSYSVPAAVCQTSKSQKARFGVPVTNKSVPQQILLSGFGGRKGPTIFVGV